MEIQQENSKPPDVPESVQPETQIEVLKKFDEIRTRFPRDKRRGTAYETELKKLKRAYPGIKFPGSDSLDIGASEREIKLGLLTEALTDLFRKKNNKVYKIDTFPKASARVLMTLNDLQLSAIAALIGPSGTSARSISRIMKALLGLGLVRRFKTGKTHSYILTDEGKNIVGQINCGH